MRSLILHLLLVALFGVCSSLSWTGNRLLVVIDDVEEKSKYSKFWGDLTARGFELSFESPKKDPAIFRHGERLFDHILILPSKLKSLGSALTPNLLLDFLQKDGNILLALSSSTATPTSIVSLLLELDIHIPPDRDALVVDHFNYDTQSAADKHDVLVVEPPASIKAGVKNFFSVDGVVAFPHTVGQVLGNASPLLSSILGAPTTAYSYNPSDEAESLEELFAGGQQLSLISSMQSRNSARFTVLGSAEMLEDTWFDAKVQKAEGKKTETANRRYAAKVSEWTFKEVGVLKVGRVQHHLNEALASSSSNRSSVDRVDLNPKIYRIKNDVTFSIELSEYVSDRLTPFTPPAGDALQLEFTMLSPYHRLQLSPISQTPNSTTFGTSFRLPDQHGIFNFRVNYKRPFFTTVDEKRTVTVRHFAHDEWPRSWRISGAWVWIAGIWTTVAGWLIFVALWLVSEPIEEERKLKKTS